MRGLSKAAPLDKGEISPLSKHTKSDLWVTASPRWFASRLRYTAARMPVSWGFRVVTDADMMVAWLATAALQGIDVRDADARPEAMVSLAKLTLVDLMDPPELLIVRLGVKAARNSAMPEVLMESLTHRGHLGKPTWVWDQPDCRYGEGHLSYSHVVHQFISSFPRVREEATRPTYGAAPTRTAIDPMDLVDESRPAKGMATQPRRRNISLSKLEGDT